MRDDAVLRRALPLGQCFNTVGQASSPQNILFQQFPKVFL